MSIMACLRGRHLTYAYEDVNNLTCVSVSLSVCFHMTRNESSGKETICKVRRQYFKTT